MNVKYELKNGIFNWRRMVFLLFFFSSILIESSVSYAQLLNKGDVAPDFTVTDMDGVQHNLYDYLNDGKYVILKFGYVGCGSCESSRPGFNNMYKDYGCNQNDIIFLEFDILWTDSEMSPALVASMGASQSGDSPNTDIDYSYPEAPYITVDGGSDPVADLYGIEFVTYEVIIEPQNKTVFGAGHYGNGEEDSWTQSFFMTVFEGGMIGPGNQPPGYSLAQVIEEEIPSAFHHVGADDILEYISNFDPLYWVPLNGAAPGDTPFTPFCEGGFTGCDLLTPSIVSYNVTADSDTTYKVDLIWSGDPTCSEIVLKYGIKNNFNSTVELTSSTTSISIPNLVSGLYDFRLRCSCNNIADYESVSVVVGAETDFTVGTGCSEYCSYDLILHNVVTTHDAPWLIGQTIWEDMRVRVESENTIEYYTLHPLEEGTIDGLWAESMTFNLTFCTNSDIDVTFVDPGRWNPFFGDAFSFAGFRLVDDQGNIVAQQAGSTVDASGNDVDVLLPAGYSGQIIYPTITSSCSDIGNAAIKEHQDFLNSVSLYPNPSDEYVMLEFADDIALEIQSIYVIDLMGRNLDVTFKELGKNKYKIHIAQLASGTYYIKINDENSIRIEKPIVKL